MRPTPLSQNPVPARTARPGFILALACLAQFMVVLDVSIVNVALPSIRSSLHYSATGLQWVVNAYVLTFAGFLMLGGRAGDLFGRRRVFLAGLGLFSLASLAGGLAQDPAWLTAARAAQGLGGAVLSPATLTIIMTTFGEGEARNRALGTWSAVAGAGGALGVVLGGVLTSALSWRWVLFVNIPIGVAGLVAGRLILAEGRRPDAGRLDVGGALTVTGGLAALVYAIVGTDTHPWGSAQTLATLAVSAVLLLAFVVIQTRVASPLVPLRLFRSRSVSGANLAMLAVGSAFFSFWYFLSLFLQGVLGYGALKAGFAFFPMGLAIIVGAQFSSRLVGRTGFRYMIVLGLGVTAGGLFWLSTIDRSSGYLANILGPGLLVSLGLGLLLTPLAGAATAGVPRQEAGLASGLLNTSRQVGGSVGLAVLATIATSRTKGLLASHHAVGASLASGYARVFLIAGILILAGLIGTAMLPRRPVTAQAGAPAVALD